MRHLKFLSLVMFFVVPAFAQGSAKPEAHRYAFIPLTDIMLTVATQPGSPLQIENPKLYYDLTAGRLDYRFDVRNRGAKPIIRFTPQFLTIIGTGGTLSGDQDKKNSVLQPGKVLVDQIEEK